MKKRQFCALSPSLLARRQAPCNYSHSRCQRAKRIWKFSGIWYRPDSRSISIQNISCQASELDQIISSSSQKTRTGVCWFPNKRRQKLNPAVLTGAKLQILLAGGDQSRANSSLENCAGNSSDVLGLVPHAPNSPIFPTW